MKNKPDYTWQCPVYEGIKRELESLQLGANIDDLNDLVDRIRRQGIPKQKAGEPVIISASTQPNVPTSSSAPASSSAAPSSTNTPAASSSAVGPQKVVQDLSQHVSNLALNSGRHATPTQPSAVDHSAATSQQARMSASDSYMIPEPAPIIAANFAHMDADDYAHEEGLLVRITMSSPTDVAQEVNLHTPLVQTATSMSYVATLTSNWLPQDVETVAKLVPLAPEGRERDHQLAIFNEAFRLYKPVNALSHPNLLSVICKEDLIVSDDGEFFMTVFEKADHTLFDFFHVYLPTQPAFTSHKMFLAQLNDGNEPRAASLTKVWRQFYDQILSAYATLHKFPRAHQRHIHPSNILLSLSSSSQVPSATIKVSDFPMLGLKAQDEMPNYTALDIATFGLPYGIQPWSDAGMASDLFSIGCVLYFITSCGESLFETPAQIQECTTNAKLQAYLKRHNVHKTDPLALDLIYRLTLPKPAERDSLAVLRHHPAAWSPMLVVKNLCHLQDELRTHPNKSGVKVLQSTLNSSTFFEYAFFKRKSWQGFIQPEWTTAWPLERGALNFESIGSLLELIHTIASKINNQVMLEAFGVSLSRHLAYFLAALWSHVASFGHFDEHHAIILTK